MRLSRTPGRDNPLERRLRSALHRAGLRFRVHHRCIAGTRRTVDIAFCKRKVAVFVDGCFWHGCPLHGTWPKRNSEFWRQKIRSNIERDRDTDRRLVALGWAVVRIWEHHSLEQAVAHIAAAHAKADPSALTSLRPRTRTRVNA
jgi:DNA mismatch endonuclease (patch repair protein)